MGADRWVVGGAAVAVLIVAGGAAALRGAAEHARAEGPPAPATLAVTCSPDGITVSGLRVAAGAGGVSLEVASTMPAGAYLEYDASGYGAGEPLPTGAGATWVRPLPPGDVELTCSTDGRARPGMSTHVSVVDRAHHWRTATLGDAGCTMTGGEPSWKYGGVIGETAQAAVDALLTEMTADSGRPYNVRDAGLGYPEAGTQTWVALGSDDRGFTIDVTRTDAGFEAGPDHLCGGLGRPPA